MKRIDHILTEIAKTHLGIPTLSPCHSDSLDFHEVSVWAVRAALAAAHDAGAQDAAHAVNADSEIDIHAVLEARRQIAGIWSIEDVQEVRPDLSEDQCWEVLQLVGQKLDATMGITWETLEYAAEELFGISSESDDD